MDFIEALQSKDHSAAYAFCLALEERSAESSDLYEYFEDFLKLLTHKSSLVRVRGFRLCCVQARWDTERKIETHLPELLGMLDDEKPTAVRQSLSALREVITYQPGLCGEIEKKLTSLDLRKYQESMRPLIEKDMEELRRTYTE